MEQQNVLKRQHGLFVSICFVVGFLVGTGIFFLPGRVLYAVYGSVTHGVLAWVIGGLMIAPCVYMFAIFAGKFEKIHGFVDYSEAIVGRKYGYLAGWFFAVMYQPAGFAIISWITSGFIATLGGMTGADPVYMPFRFFISAFNMAMVFMINYFIPKIPVKLNVATTVARMIPLVLMGTVGVFVAWVLRSQSMFDSVLFWGATVSDNVFLYGETAEDFRRLLIPERDINMFAAISATAFAFNGWQAALAFNSEVKDSKRKFPFALMFGFGIIIVIYVLYFIGVTTASADATWVLRYGSGANFARGTHMAFNSIFGETLGGLLIVFMIISGLGILNACCLGMSRAMFSLGKRDMGPMPERMKILDPITNVPNNSMVIAVGIGFAWLVVIFANQFWFHNFTFSLPDFYNYSFFGMLIPIFICFMLRQTDVHPAKRFFFPILAIIGAGFMFATYWIGSPRHAAIYTATFTGLALLGYVCHVWRRIILAIKNKFLNHIPTDISYDEIISHEANNDETFHDETHLDETHLDEAP